jgi:hypothetical protein
MTDSVFTDSVVEGSEVAPGSVDLARLPELPAVPDAGREGEHALADPRPYAFWGVPAVQLQGQLALGGLVDRLDPLTHGAQGAEARPLVAAIGTHEHGVEAGDRPLELLPGETLVGNDRLPAGEQPRATGPFEQRRRDLALGLVRRRQAEADRRAAEAVHACCDSLARGRKPTEGYLDETATQRTPLSERRKEGAGDRPLDRLVS